MACYIRTPDDSAYRPFSLVVLRIQDGQIAELCRGVQGRGQIAAHLVQSKPLPNGVLSLTYQTASD